MSGLALKRLTSFDFAVGLGYLEVWVNPSQVAYVQPRRRYDTKTDRHSLDGCLLFFQQEAGRAGRQGGHRLRGGRTAERTWRRVQ